MSEPPRTSGAPASARGAGPAGRGLVIRNVLSNWIWYGLVVTSGFLIPRWIKDFRGAELLGVWDYCWTLVGYVGLLSLGVVSAVSRYVARYRVSSDWHALNEIVNSSLLLLTASCAAAIGAVTLIDFVGLSLADEPLEVTRNGYWVALLTVSAAALLLPAGAFNGVITGYERYDALNAIRWARDLLMLGGMLAALWLGYGLVALGWILLITEILATIAKIVVAQRICPALRISPRYLRAHVMRDAVQFGGKTVLQELARGGVHQAAALIIAPFFGSTALAVFSRPRNLVMHVYKFTKQYAQVFVPKSAALQAQDDDAGLRNLLIQTSRWGYLLAFPMMAVLALCGGDILEVWMGPMFRAAGAGALVAFAIGHALAVGQQSVFSILMGMGKHGVAALCEIGAAALAVLTILLGVNLWQWGLVEIAVTIGAAITLSGGLLLPAYACRLLALPVGHYARATLGPALAAVAPFVGALATTQLWGPGDHRVRLGVSLTVGGAVLFATYWAFIFPADLKRRALKKLRIPVRSPAPAAGAAEC